MDMEIISIEATPNPYRKNRVYIELFHSDLVDVAVGFTVERMPRTPNEWVHMLWDYRYKLILPPGKQRWDVCRARALGEYDHELGDGPAPRGVTAGLPLVPVTGPISKFRRLILESAAARVLEAGVNTAEATQARRDLAGEALMFSPENDRGYQLPDGRLAATEEQAVWAWLQRSRERGAIIHPDRR